MGVEEQNLAYYIFIAIRKLRITYRAKIFPERKIQECKGSFCCWWVKRHTGRLEKIASIFFTRKEKKLEKKLQLPKLF